MKPTSLVPLVIRTDSYVDEATGECSEDEEFVPPLRIRRKLSTPITALTRNSDKFLNVPASDVDAPGKSLSTFDRTKRRFSTMVSGAAASAITRRLSATIGWCLSPSSHVKPHIVRQGRALALQYIRIQLRRSLYYERMQIVVKRLHRMTESECGEEATNNIETGVLSALRALCAALERKKPELFYKVARQATRAPSAVLKSETALTELTLALGRRITSDNITWSKIAAVYSVCGALAKEAAEAADGEASLDLVSAPADAIADLLHEDTGFWVTAQGGWDELVNRLKTSERDQRTEKSLRIIIFIFVVICTSLLLLRWTIHIQHSLPIRKKDLRD